MSKRLRRACEECVADAGKEDKELVNRLYNYIHKNYEVKGEPWTYSMIDVLIDRLDKNYDT